MRPSLRRAALGLALLACWAAAFAAKRPAAAKPKEDIDLDTALFALDEATGAERAGLIRGLAASKDPRAAEALVQVLANPKQEDTAELQDLAYKALYRLRSPVIVPDLKKMLESDKEAKVVYAIGLLGRTLGPKAFDLIEPHLRSEGEVLNAAIKAIGETGNPKAVESLNVTLKRVGPKSDASVFVRMSLIRLGDKTQLKPLIAQYQEIIDEAFLLKGNLKYVDSPLKKQRDVRRIQYLWSVQAELRAYFGDLTADMVPAMVEAVETTDADMPKQIILELVPRMMDRDRAGAFAAMLDSRYLVFRQLVIDEYVRLKDAGLRQAAAESVRRHLGSAEWPDRRHAVMNAGLLPEAERMAALARAAEDPQVWVRAEAVRELGRVRTPEALALIERVRGATDHEELRFVCRCALAGVEEDLHGLR